MSRLRIGRSIAKSSAAIALGLLILTPAGCAVDGVGYGGGYGYGADYYEPYGVAYGGWGDGYYVGPYRDHGFHGDWRGHDGGHAFRAGPAGHAPSIPSGPRGGGRGGGGGHGGGGHGR